MRMDINMYMYMCMYLWVACAHAHTHTHTHTHTLRKEPPFVYIPVIPRAPGLLMGISSALSMSVYLGSLELSCSGCLLLLSLGACRGVTCVSVSQSVCLSVCLSMFLCMLQHMHACMHVCMHMRMLAANLAIHVNVLVYEFYVRNSA